MEQKVRRSIQIAAGIEARSKQAWGSPRKTRTHHVDLFLGGDQSQNMGCWFPFKPPDRVMALIMASVLEKNHLLPYCGWLWNLFRTYETSVSELIPPT